MSKVYLIQYFHNDNWWILELYADDDADAQARIDKLSQAQLLGERGGVIPAGDDERPSLRVLH